MRLLLHYTLFLGLGLAGGLGLAYWRQRAAEAKEGKEEQTLLVERLTALGQLELLAYQVRDVVRREWRYNLPLARSRLLIILTGEARICMDFAQIRIQEADWRQRTLKLALPPPYVCQVRIDPQSIQVYEADFSFLEWWRSGEAERLRELLTAAQETLRVRISQHFPQAAAQAQAERLLSRLCHEMGWEKVSFHSPTPP
ncbi:MAG: DUF4230 domain-containing protein [Bacteroidia bacterium]|nr:DUF4230 domain-containing protein [Bacteroidia bacterium]MDW8089540.1 DUF4230 domain-containing protein [Bacteroidia bacterium]